nr:hypothetical protein REQ54_01079 [Rhizobium sp. Q54]
MANVSDTEVKFMLKVFSRKHFDLSDSDNPDRVGGKIIQQQAQLHNRIAQIASRLAGSARNTNVATRAASAFKQFTQQVTSVASHSIRREGEVPVVAGNAPVLDEDDVDKLEEQLLGASQSHLQDPRYVEQALASLMATYRDAFRIRDAELEAGALGSFVFAFNEALSRLSWLSHRQREADEIAVLEGSFKSRLAEFDALASKNSADVFGMRNSIESLEEMLASLTGDTHKVRNEFADVEKKIAATEAAFNERIGLKETDKLWKGEALKATWSFYLTGLLLLVVLVSIPLLVYGYRTELLEFLSKLEENAVKLTGGERPVTAAVLVVGRLLLLTIPIGSLIWAIKLLVRFNVRSMLLMDDANQRVTMLNTYLFLVRQQAASTHDRGALLEAMFRRAPGHGPETIDPPNMVEILNYGKEIGKPAP